MENLNEENIKTEKINSIAEYKAIVSAVKEMDKQCNDIVESVSAQISSTYGVEKDILTYILPYEKNSIPNLERKEIVSFLTRYAKFGHEDDFEKMTDEELVETMSTIKAASIMILSAKNDAKEIKKDTADLLKDFIENNPERKSERIEKMESAIENDELTEEQKADMKKKIDIMHSAYNFDFLNERFDIYGEKEIENIKNGFFDLKKGSYIINKYNSKMKLFGFDKNVYKFFYNIEEKLIDKKYSPFNNLFLYIFMRMVAYNDPYNKKDKLFIQSLTSALSKLVYHKFDSNEEEKTFIAVIEKTLDKFEKYRDYFIENNTTYEEHPARKEADSRHEMNRKESLIKKMNDLKIEGYDENWSADELQRYFNDETDKLIQKQLEEEKAEKEVESTEDVSEEIEETVEDLSEETELVEESETE